MVLIVSGINFILMAIGAFWFYPRYVGTVINGCYGCCHCCAWIMALSSRFNPLGDMCSINVAPNKYEAGKWSDASTYKSDGAELAALSSI